MPTREQALQAVARGWSHPINADKEMDADLAVAIANEVALLPDNLQLAEEPQPGEPAAVLWRDMADAPTDGTDFLAELCFEDGTPYDLMTIRWHAPWQKWVMSGCLIDLGELAPSRWIAFEDLLSLGGVR